MGMPIEIVDEKKMLSTHQRAKVKRMVSNRLKTTEGMDDLDTYLMKEVLPSLTWSSSSNVDEGYNRLRYEEREDRLVLVFERLRVVDQDRNLRRRLRAKMVEKQSLRRPSGDETARLWKTYHLLRQYTPKGVDIPNPTTIRSMEQRRVFEEMVEKMPSSDFKTYVEDCLRL